MNDHIAKPIDPDQLFGVLLRWIRRPDGDGAGVREWIEARPAATPTAASVAPVARRPARDRRHRRQVGAEANRRQPQALRDIAAPICPPTGDHGGGHPQGAVHGGCGCGGACRTFLEGCRRDAWGGPPVGGGRQGRDCDQDGDRASTVRSRLSRSTLRRRLAPSAQHFPTRPRPMVAAYRATQKRWSSP